MFAQTKILESSGNLDVYLVEKKTQKRPLNKIKIRIFMLTEFERKNGQISTGNGFNVIN